MAGQQGRLNDACRLATAALQTAEGERESIELFELDARQVLGQVRFERNELDAAQDQMEGALRHCWSIGATPYMWMVETDLVRVMIARQQSPEALHRLHT